MGPDVVQLTEGKNRFLIWRCVGCGETHSCLVVGNARPRWSWNRSLSKPTLVPSILKKPDNGERCHSFVRDGFVQFLGDSTHALAGESVEMLPENAGMPREPSE